MGNLFKSTPRKLRKFLIECIQSGVVPNIVGSPGIGKSSIVGSVARDFDLFLIDHRLSTSEPTDMTGLPEFRQDGDRRRASFAPFDIFPLEGEPLPPLLDSDGKQQYQVIEGKKELVTHDGWMLFLDEANAAPRSVQAAAYKLVLDRKVGQHKLHKKVAVVLAGNLTTDRAIVNPLSTAMQSRLVHIEVETNFEEWTEDVAVKEHYDARIIGFLNQYPEKLMDFKPDHHEATFCCPRTWEFVNKLITEDSKILLTGAITSGVALEFVKFSEIYASMVSITDICKDPKNCPVPSNKSLMWAVITHMMDKISNQNFDDLATYADRFELPFRILFYRSILIRTKNAIRTHKHFGKHAAAMAKYLAPTTP